MADCRGPAAHGSRRARCLGADHCGSALLKRRRTVPAMPRGLDHTPGRRGAGSRASIEVASIALIDVLAVDPADQQRLTEILIAAIDGSVGRRISSLQPRAGASTAPR